MTSPMVALSSAASTWLLLSMTTSPSLSMKMPPMVPAVVSLCPQLYPGFIGRTFCVNWCLIILPTSMMSVGMPSSDDGMISSALYFLRMFCFDFFFSTKMMIASCSVGTPLLHL